MVPAAGSDEGSTTEVVLVATAGDGAEFGKEGWAAGSVIGAEPESTAISLEPDREGEDIEGTGTAAWEPEDSGSGATA
jgi:hypothetical protein